MSLKNVIIFPLLALQLFIQSNDAYVTDAASRHLTAYLSKNRGKATQINMAWGLPTESFDSLRDQATQLSMSWSLPTDTFKSTWYDQVNDPTARRTVYEDVPMEYTFATPLSDWSSLENIRTEQLAEQPKQIRPRRLGFLRRAARSALRKIRRA